MKVIGLLNEIYNGNTDLPDKIKVDNVIFYKDYVGNTIEYYNYNNNSNPDGILLQDYFKENYNTKAFLKLEVEEVKEEVRWKLIESDNYKKLYDRALGDVVRLSKENAELKNENAKLNLELGKLQGKLDFKKEN